MEKEVIWAEMWTHSKSRAVGISAETEQDHRETRMVLVGCERRGRGKTDLCVCFPVGEFLDAQRAHEWTLVRPWGARPIRVVYDDLSFLQEGFVRDELLVETWTAVVEHAEGKKEGEHELSRHDFCRSGVCEIEGTLEHGHEFDMIAVDTFAQVEIVLLLFPKRLYDARYGIGGPVENVRNDLNEGRV